MSDNIDRAQDIEQFNRDMALKARDGARPAWGQLECKCGEPISYMRQSLGAIRCMHCQQLFEKDKR